MLVLSRKPGEKVFIGNDVSLVVLKVRGDRVQLGIEAPGHVRIVRVEICDRLAKNAG